MKIIIIGDGKVGHSLAENLSKDGNDVTIIDKNADALRKAIDNLDVMCIKGTGASTKILMEAGVGEADLLIAATTSDEMNMVCCLTAKKLGAAHTIARIRDPEYANELSLLKDKLDLDMVINPEQTAAYEIAKHFRFPYAYSIDSFYKGRVNMVGYKIYSHNPIIGMKIQDVSKKYKYPVIIGAVERNDDVVVPGGDFVIQENDIIHIIGKPSSVFNFCNSLCKYCHKIKNIMIVGGGRISYYLTKAIADMGIKVKIIEIDMEKCLELTELLPDTLIINGDGTDDELLESENLRDVDAFISLTGRDEDNLMTALLAKQYGVSKVIAKVTRMNYSAAVKGLGLDTLISPRKLITNHILKYVRGLKNAEGSTIESLYRIIDDRAEAIIFKTDESTQFLNIPISKLKIDKGVLIAAILRQNDIIIPSGNDTIKKGDRILVITNILTYEDINEILDRGKLDELQNSIKKLGDSINM